MRRARKAKVSTIRPVRPNAGLQARYQRALDAIVEDMNKSVTYWLKATWRANEPEMVALAQDDSPAATLRNAIRGLRRRWEKDFNEFAKRWGRRFPNEAGATADRTFAASLRQAGLTVKFQTTRAVNDILQASVAENVSLIKSIPEQYFTGVESAVMQSVVAGRDLGTLAEELTKRHGVTKRRAALIARDQNNKITAAMNRARQLELGITEAIWMHSAAGKVPRPSHVKMNGQRFDVAKGMWDPDEKKWIQPGELINCRCVSRSVLPKFGG